MNQFAAQANSIDDEEGRLSPVVMSKFCHDCRTPLAVVAEFASIISEDLGPTASPDVLEFLEIISDRTHEIEGLIADFQYLYKTHNGTARPKESFCVGELLRELRVELDTIARPLGKRVRLELGGQRLTVHADRSAITRSIVAVVTNLARCRSGEGVITIMANRDETSGLVQLNMVGSTGASDEISPSQVLEAPNHVPPGDHEMNFRVKMAALLLAADGGRLTVVPGAEHCALGIHLPESSGG